MSEIVRIRNSKGGWLPVRFLGFGEGQVPGRTVQGIIVQIEDDTFPTPIETENVHPDDFRRLVDHFAKSKD